MYQGKRILRKRKTRNAKDAKRTNRTSRRTMQKGGLKRTAKIRVLMYKDHQKKPQVMIRVQKGPRNDIRDMILYGVNNTENDIANVVKGFPKAPYREEILAIQYNE
jgi:hypothetical protein